MEAVETARKEQEKISGKRERENTVTQKMFRVVAQTFDNRAKALEARLQLQKKYKDVWILNKRP